MVAYTDPQLPPLLFHSQQEPPASNQEKSSSLQRRDIQLDSPWIWIPLSVLRGMKLPRIARGIYLTLCSFASRNKKQECFPSLRTIAEESDYSIRQCQRGLNILIKAGLIQRILKRGGTKNRVNLYRLLAVNPRNTESIELESLELNELPSLSNEEMQELLMEHSFQNMEGMKFSEKTEQYNFDSEPFLFTEGAFQAETDLEAEAFPEDFEDAQETASQSSGLNFFLEAEGSLASEPDSIVESLDLVPEVEREAGFQSSGLNFFLEAEGSLASEPDSISEVSTLPLKEEQSFKVSTVSFKTDFEKTFSPELRHVRQEQFDHTYTMKEKSIEILEPIVLAPVPEAPKSPLRGDLLNTNKTRFTRSQLEPIILELKETWEDKCHLHLSPRDNQAYLSNRSLRAISRAIRSGLSIEELKQAIERYEIHLRKGKNGLKFARTFANFFSKQEFRFYLPKPNNQENPEITRIRTELAKRLWLNKEDELFDSIQIIDKKEEIPVIRLGKKLSETILYSVTSIFSNVYSKLRIKFEDYYIENYRLKLEEGLEI